MFTAKCKAHCSFMNRVRFTLILANFFRPTEISWVCADEKGLFVSPPSTNAVFNHHTLSSCCTLADTPSHLDNLSFPTWWYHHITWWDVWGNRGLRDTKKQRQIGDCMVSSFGGDASVHLQIMMTTMSDLTPYHLETKTSFKIFLASTPYVIPSGGLEGNKIKWNEKNVNPRIHGIDGIAYNTSPNYTSENLEKKILYYKRAFMVYPTFFCFSLKCAISISHKESANQWIDDFRSYISSKYHPSISVSSQYWRSLVRPIPALPSLTKTDCFQPPMTQRCPSESPG